MLGARQQAFVSEISALIYDLRRWKDCGVAGVQRASKGRPKGVPSARGAGRPAAAIRYHRYINRHPQKYKYIYIYVRFHGNGIV